MATLVYSDVDGHDHTIALGAEPITVGRAPEATIRSVDPRVSRMHARFFVEGGVLWVEDLGSQNGVFVGPNRVQRAPVPTGELILVGSVMVRLLPASGTLPPPVGLHGTLGQWLSMERKTRIAVEEERDAFARRVGQIHDQLNQQLAHQPVAGDPEAIRLRDEAEARAAALERALASVQDELAATREAAGNPLDRDESAAALLTADQARLAAEKDAQGVREELDKLRKASQLELEAARTELAKVREAKAVAETQAGMQVAEKLAEADFRIADLEAELKKAKAAQQPAGPDPKLQQLSEQVTTLTARAEKAEKEFMQIQIRAQGAERNLSAAQSAAAMAETRAAQIEDRAKELEAKLKMREVDAQSHRERAEELEKTVVPTMAKAQALVEQAERAGKLEREFAEVTQAFETRSVRIIELEAEVTKLRDRVVQAEDLAAGATATAEIAKGEAGEAAAKVADAERRAAEMKARLDAAGGHESAIAVATKAKDDALSRAVASEQRAEDAEHRADDAEKRAAAADTMQKAMAKDVAEALRRAAEADSKAKAQIRELSEARTKAEELDKRFAELEANRVASEERAVALAVELHKSKTELEAKLARAESEHAEHVASTQRELAARAEAHQREVRTRVEETQRELTTQHETVLSVATAATEAKLKDVQQKLEQLGRELAAERQSSLALVESKTNLEHQLAEAEELAQRTEQAESRAVELEVQLEQLQEKIEDLESNVAIAETAREAGIQDERGKVAQLEAQLRDAAHLVKAAGDELATVQSHAQALEAQLKTSELGRSEAGEALAAARAQLAEAIASAQEHRGSREAEQEKLEEALGRASEAERRAEGLARSAEAADLAIGRAGALQRQLDEAIAKLSYLEREGTKNNNAAERDALAEKLAQAEAAAQKAQERVRDSSAKLEGLRELEARGTAAEQKIGELEKKLTDAERRASGAEQRAASAEQRATSIEQRAVAAEQRAIAAEADAASAGVAGEELEEARARITELEDELSKADNVRSFAAETEREIAGLQRELRDAKANLSRVTLERDRFESELADSREDDETRDRAMPVPDLGKLPALMARVAELEKQNQVAQREVATLQQQLADAEDKAESTTTGTQLPLASMAEQVSILEESIDSLRSNMRAASDETAMMDQTESVTIVASAVSQAAEHIERARVAVKVLVKSFNH